MSGRAPSLVRGTDEEKALRSIEDARAHYASPEFLVATRHLIGRRSHEARRLTGCSYRITPVLGPLRVRVSTARGMRQNPNRFARLQCAPCFSATDSGRTIRLHHASTTPCAKRIPHLEQSSSVFGGKSRYARGLRSTTPTRGPRHTNYRVMTLANLTHPRESLLPYPNET